MEFTPEVFIQLAIGLALFAFGWSLFRFGIRAIGFGLGFMAGFSTYELLIEWVPKINPDFMRYLPQHELASVFLGSVLGLVGMFLAKKMYMAVIFIAVFLGCLYILYSPDSQQRGLIEDVMIGLNIYGNINNTLGNLWPAVLALIIAGIFLLLQKQVVILLTAAAGSYIIAETIRIPILFLPMIFIGYLIQQTQKKRGRKAKAKQEAED